MPEVAPKHDYIPNRLNQENLLERKSTFLATARSTDDIRKKVKAGFYTGMPSKEVYMSMHARHVEENPERVYLQEDTPDMNSQYDLHFATTLDDYLQAGIYRKGHCMVGEFYNMPPDEVEDYGNFLFEAIDRLFAQPDFLQKLDEDQKLLILVIIDQMFVLGHFVKNASGRTGEDFLHYLGTQMKLPFTVSTSGFRGQFAPDRLEKDIESTFWVYRKIVATNVMLAAQHILSVLRPLADAAESNDTNLFNEILLRHEIEDLSVSAIVEAFREATTRQYLPLPEDTAMQDLLGEAAARSALVETQDYDSYWIRVAGTKEYLLWHLEELKKIEAKLRLAGIKTVADMIQSKMGEAFQKISNAEQTHHAQNLRVRRTRLH